MKKYFVSTKERYLDDIYSKYLEEDIFFNIFI